MFGPVLASPYTQMLFPDARECVQRHRSHVLIEVQQGVFGAVEDKPDIAAMFQKIGFPRAGRDLGSFNRRVDILAEACRFLHKQNPASAVHWTQSNMLVGSEKLDDFLQQTGPGLLTIHPMMFGSAKTAGFKETPVEIYTVGAADYIGREIHTDPVPIPWVDVYQSILAFVNLATAPDGYIIPDGDTFGVETDEFSWRITYLDGKNPETINGQPYYNMKLQYHRKHGYTAPDFTGRELIKGGIWEAASLISDDQTRREWIAGSEKNQDMARKAGGQFRIFQTNEKPQAPVFGKRKN